MWGWVKRELRGAATASGIICLLAIASTFKPNIKNLLLDSEGLSTPAALDVSCGCSAPLKIRRLFRCLMWM